MAERIEHLQSGRSLSARLASEMHLNWLLRRQTIVIAWVALAVAAVLPRNGTGISLCTFYRVTQLPCPGCGMTRSLIAFAHCRFHESYLFHPFGIPLGLGCAVVASAVFWPERARRRVSNWLESHKRLSAVFFGLGVGGWFAYGLVRLWLVALGYWKFPG